MVYSNIVLGMPILVTVTVTVIKTGCVCASKHFVLFQQFEICQCLSNQHYQGPYHPSISGRGDHER